VQQGATKSWLGKFRFVRKGRPELAAAAGPAAFLLFFSEGKARTLRLHRSVTRLPSETRGAKAGAFAYFVYVFPVSLPTKFDHCVVHVSDWERSNNFYRDVVGVELVEKNGRWAYRFANAQLNLHGPGVKAEPLARIAVPPGGSDLCFEWSGPISEAVEHLKAHDVKIELGPVQRSGACGDGTSIYFRDPDGSLLEFISYADTKTI
jgi:catechol 2,3-dioxygenase-like lactoylglutathione lyase family enzyme